MSSTIFKRTGSCTLEAPPDETTSVSWGFRQRHEVSQRENSIRMVQSPSLRHLDRVARGSFCWSSSDARPNRCLWSPQVSWFAEYRVVVVSGEIRGWLHMQSKWTRIDKDELLPQGTIVQMMAGSRIALRDIRWPKGIGGFGRDLKLTASEDMVVRLNPDLVRDFPDEKPSPQNWRGRQDIQ